MENISRDGNTRPPYCPLRNLYAGQEATVRTGHGTIVQNWKGVCQAVYCQSAYLTYIEGTSCTVRGWMKHKLESRLPGEISITSYMQMWHNPYGRK